MPEAGPTRPIPKPVSRDGLASRNMPEIVELERPGAIREFRVNGVATASEAVDAVSNSVVLELIPEKIAGAADSWYVKVRCGNRTNPPEPVEHRPEPPPAPTQLLLRAPRACLKCKHWGELISKAIDSEMERQPPDTRTGAGENLEPTTPPPEPPPAPPLPAITEDDVARWLNIPVETLRNTPRSLDDHWLSRIQQIIGATAVEPPPKPPNVTDCSTVRPAPPLPHGYRASDCVATSSELSSVSRSFRVTGSKMDVKVTHDILVTLTRGTNRPSLVIEWGPTEHCLAPKQTASEATRELLDKLARIGCLKPEYCDGPEDGEPAGKDMPSPTRCHRCAAVRLARSVVGRG